MSVERDHRASLESAGPQNSCDRLTAFSDNQLPADSHSACMHADACNFHALWESAGSWLSLNAVKQSQELLCTIKRARSLEKLYDWDRKNLFPNFFLILMSCIIAVQYFFHQCKKVPCPVCGYEKCPITNTTTCEDKEKTVMVWGTLSTFTVVTFRLSTNI